MAEKENSAFRLYRFIQKMVPQSNNTITSQVVLNAFGAEKNGGPRQQNLMLSKVTALLFTELDLLVAELKRHEYSDEAINPITVPFDRLTAGMLASEWAHNKNQFAASLPVLRSIGESPFLVADDAVVTKDDLATVSADVASLREQVQSSELPDAVKRFICQQLDIIAEAIREYPITGIKVFKQAAKHAILHELENSDIVEQYVEAPQMTGLKAIQTKIVKFSKFSIEFSKLLSAMDTIYRHGAPVLQTATGAAHHLSGWLQLSK